MFAGGTGITPMYQLLQAIAVDDEDTTTVDLHFCNRSVGDVLLFEKLKAMEQASKGKFKITFYVDEGPAPEGIEEGILTSAAVEEIIAGSDSTGMVLGCGPPGMIDEALLPAMNATGVTSAQRGYIF
ncbi:NADH-cytochrome b5 reductase 3 [Perkinsus olseni]|uniref:NADH-cytochrome b5 reductase 3 n=1 Tax=Perkinsus olseni TaxID=32597 RepID=A0A7J6LVD6_PEROL|nr:NADH-cytochrome b5 reductase 3 [Perkinsus olseni]